jgi:xanthine dehydrogenase YagR molybdenum-binding subunit
MKPPPVMMSTPKAAGPSDLPIMQDGEVHWNGQPVALVLAKTQEQADHAKSLVRVAYEMAPGAVSFDEAKTRVLEPPTASWESHRLSKSAMPRRH